jgi:hypothetical protein
MQETKLKPLKALDLAHQFAVNFAPAQPCRCAVDSSLELTRVDPRVVTEVAPVEKEASKATTKPTEGQEKVESGIPPVVVVSQFGLKIQQLRWHEEQTRQHEAVAQVEEWVFQ